MRWFLLLLITTSYHAFALVLPHHGLRPPSHVLKSSTRTSHITKGPIMSLSKVSLHFDFDNIPYAAGIQHIHSPEHVSETHRLGAPFFKVDSVDEPRLTSDKKTSVSFKCSTLFMKNLHVRMFSGQPNESNMIFFKDQRALYSVKFTAIPTKVCFMNSSLFHHSLTNIIRPSCPIAFASTSLSSPAAAR